MAEQTTLLPINKTRGRSGSPKHASFVLGRRGSLMVSKGVAAHTLWTSAAPPLTYRLYALILAIVTRADVPKINRTR